MSDFRFQATFLKSFIFLLISISQLLGEGTHFSSVQSLSHVRLFATPWLAAPQASLSIINSQSSPKLMSIELVMPSSRLILCRPLLLLPPIPPSIRVFSNESTLCMRWSKYWSFSISISPSKEHPRLTSFRMDCLDLLAIQGTLKSLLQHHSFKASSLWHSAFFTVQLSHPHMTTGKTIALTRKTFVGKVMCLFFNMLSRLVIAFLPRNKCLVISWLQSPSAVIFEPKKIKSFTVFIFSPSFQSWVFIGRTDAEAEAPILCSPDAKNGLIGKTPRLGKTECRRMGGQRMRYWMASLTRWRWDWASYRSWWQTVKLVMLQSMRLQRVWHNWATKLNLWT